MALPFPAHAFVNSLDLPEPVIAAQAASSACVAGHSLVSFTAGLSRQNREDVLNSTLLMQLAANARYNKESERQSWFKFYIDGLGTLGWTISDGTFEAYNTSQLDFTVQQAVIAIIGGLAQGAAFTPVVAKSLAALKEDPQALALFESHSDQGVSGMFQILPCAQTEQGNVTMLLNCMQLQNKAERHRVLFFSHQSREVQLFHSTQQAVLDTRIYREVREAVLNKLGHNANQFVKQLKL